MGCIDVHTHYVPRTYLDSLRKKGKDPNAFGFPVVPWDVEKRLRTMEKYDIDVEILSLSSEPGLGFWDGEERRALTRQLNDELADIVRRRPKRFGGFATLPLPDLDGALAELARAYDELSLDGVVLLSNYGGVYLGDPKLDPIFAEIDRRRGVLFVHPSESPCSDRLSQGYVAPAFEYPAETTRMVASLIDHDVTTRYPDMRIIVSHGGGTIPMIQDRMELSMPWKRKEDAGSGAERIKRAIGSLYCDLAGVSYPAPLAAIRLSHEVSRVLMGYDLPFMPVDVMEGVKRNFDAFDGFSDAQKEMIRHSNALNLFPRLAQ